MNIVRKPCLCGINECCVYSPMARGFFRSHRNHNYCSNFVKKGKCFCLKSDKLTRYETLPKFAG